MAQDDFLQFQERVKQAESRGQRYGKDGKLLTSPKGAQGEMQVMPGTQADPGFGVRPAKPGDAEDIARVGRDYLAAMDKRYGGNRVYAAVAYNWGPGNADKWIKGGADFSKLPAETQAYVQAVTGEAPKVSQDVAQAPKASPVVAQAPSPKAPPAADMGVGYQAALALSFLDDKDNEDDDEKAVAKLDEEEDTQAAKMLAEYKPYNALADLDLTSTAPRQFQNGGDVGKNKMMTEGEFEAMMNPEPSMWEKASNAIQSGARQLLDSAFPVRRVVRAGLEPTLEAAHERYVLQDPETVYQNRDITSKGAATANFHIKNALRKSLGLEPLPSNAVVELPPLETNSFPVPNEGIPPPFGYGKAVRRADGSPESGEVTGINKLVDFVAQRLDPSMFPTSARTLLETVQGAKTPITESNFSPEEHDIMRQLAVLKGGQKGNIDYGDYVKLAEQMKKTGKVPVSVTPGLLSMSDPLGNVQTTLGRFSYKTDPKGNLQVVDRYDFNPIYDQGAMQEAQTGDYGALNPYGLVRNYAGQKIPPGKGREVLINLGPVKRADGSPEGGERPLTAEEIEAASKPAFLTPKSGIGRKISTKPGQIEGAVAQGVSETPYNLVGAPVDIATMAMRPFGYSVEKPVMGSDWIKEKMSAAGVRPQPPSDPTSRAFYEIGQLGGGAINPAAPVRGAVAAAEKTGEAAKMLARDFQTYNQQLAVPGASYAIRPQQGGHFVYNTYSKEDEVDHFLRVNAGVAPFQNDPLSNWMRKRFGNYMRGTMGTEADPLVKAADSGKQLHFMDEHGMSYQSPNSVNLQWLRPQMGLPKEGFAKTEAGKAAEAAVDSGIVPLPIKEVMPNYRTPKMEELANKDPEAPVYQLDHEELDDALKPESLKIALRNMLEETWLPPELRITPEQLQKMTLVEASEKANKFEKFIQAKEAQDLMKGSASVPIFKKYDDGYNWFLPQDVKEDPLAKQFVLKAGNNARWCTEKEGHCLAYASGRKSVMVLVSPKGNPRVQLSLEKSDDLDMAYDWLLTLTPEERKGLQNTYYMHQLTELPQFKQWARSNPDTEILEIKGRFNSDELKGDDLKKTQDLIRSGNWIAVHELKNAKLTDAYTLPGEYGNSEDIINRFGTRYLTDDELFQITPKEKATGGMIERRTDDTRRYL